MWTCKLHKGRKPKHKCRIFEIGLGATGSRSVSLAVEHLGIVTRHHFGCGICKKDALKKLLLGRCDYDIYKACEYSSNIAFIHWKQLAERYPQARFVLTTRPIDDWLKKGGAIKCNLKRRRTRILQEKPVDWATLVRFKMFGKLTFIESEWKDYYIKYHEEVSNHFQGSKRLLTVNVFEENPDDLWKKLGEFFDRPFPSNLTFPRVSNRRSWKLNRLELKK